MDVVMEEERTINPSKNHDRGKYKLKKKKWSNEIEFQKIACSDK
jgi:hypothetical protein